MTKPMKASELQNQLTAHLALADKIPALEEANVENEAHLDKLLSDFDLKDRKKLDDLVRLYALSAIHPRLVAIMEQRGEDSERKLLAATNDFVHQTLSPAVRELSAKASAKLRASLKFAYKNQLALDRAIEESDVMQRIGSLSLTATLEQNPVGGVVNCVQRKLAALETMAEIEASLA